MAGAIDIGPEFDGVRVQPGVLPGLSGDFDAPAQAVNVRPQGEDHPVGMQRADGDHFGTGCRDFDRDFVCTCHPFNSAFRWAVRKLKRRDRACNFLRDIDLVKGNGLTLQIGLQVAYITFKLVQPGGGP